MASETETVPGDAQSENRYRPGSSQRTRRHQLVLQFTFGGWYAANAWGRLALSLVAWIVVLAAEDARATCRWWGWAALAAATIGALLAVAHQRWPVWLESRSEGMLYRLLSGQAGGPVGWIAAHAMPHSGTFQANLPGTVEAVGGLGLVLLTAGPWPLAEASPSARVLLAACAILFLVSAISQWLMDPAMYAFSSGTAAFVRVGLSIAVAVAAFALFGPLTTDLVSDPGERMVIGLAAALPFLALLLAARGEDLFVAKALAAGDHQAALTRSELSVDLHGAIKQPARILGAWLELKGVDDENVLAAYHQLCLSIEGFRQRLVDAAGTAGPEGPVTVGEALRALRVLTQTTGREIRVDAAPDLLASSDPTATQVVFDLVVNAMTAGTGAVDVLVEDRDGAMTVTVADEGGGPDPATWLLEPTASTTQLAARLRRQGGDLVVLREAGAFRGVVASWPCRTVS